MLMLGEDDEYRHYGAEIFNERIYSVKNVEALHADIDH
jgi:hypothetical protein